MGLTAGLARSGHPDRSKCGWTLWLTNETQTTAAGTAPNGKQGRYLTCKPPLAYAPLS